ncbi:hypothetical protein [Corynebacterium lactis]|uniref:hypothetical protein n=1 Tax=Corynebacterium lactis TaxID=1231000 RepID=UPI0012E2CD27|nr:hypothetical protein [Corynebacterium lactis]
MRIQSHPYAIADKRKIRSLALTFVGVASARVASVVGSDTCVCVPALTHLR